MTVPIRQDKRRGFILVIVLWFMASLSLLTVSFGMSARGGIKLVGNEISSAKELALLDAGIELAAARLALSDPEDRWLADGKAHHINFAGAELNIRVYDPSRRIDINKSDGALLNGLLRQFVDDKGLADKITGQILDWRRDRKIGPGGGTGGVQPGRPRSSEGANGSRFIDVTEVQYVAGVTPSLYQRLRPFLTVHSDDGRINPLSARRQVLLAIPSMTAVDTDEFLEIRKYNRHDETLIKALPSSVHKWLTTQAGQAFDVVVEVKLEADRPGQFAAVTIMPGADTRAPYRVLRRRLMAIAPGRGEDTF